MRKLQLATVIVTLALAIPFTILALIEAVYLIEYARDIGGALAGTIEWRTVAVEGSARWPEVVGMIVGQMLILSMLLFVRRDKSAGGPDLFENVRREQTEPPRRK